MTVKIKSVEDNTFGKLALTEYPLGHKRMGRSQDMNETKLLILLINKLIQTCKVHCENRKKTKMEFNKISKQILTLFYYY